MFAGDLYDCLTQNDVGFFCGVPDSLLKDFCAYITDHTPVEKHIITANEGNAIAMAAGYHLATNKIGLVYMQNSGLGNCVNPLLSLTDEKVYNIPLLMMVGWRGEPGVKDEPQHVKQGMVTDTLLDAMGVKYSILPDSKEDMQKAVAEAIKHINNTNSPYAFVVKKGSFDKYSLKSKRSNNNSMSREEAIGYVVSSLSPKDIVVSTTGQISRELYEIRKNSNQSHEQDFLTVGSMGHASSIALPIALMHKDRNVFCFDGDGAFLMHMGALPVVASMKLNNYKHIVFNNEAHDSVGSQPTVANILDFKNVATSCGYSHVYSVSSKEELDKILPEFVKNTGTNLLEIKVKCGSRDDLGRPKETPVENKEKFMSFVSPHRTIIGKNTVEKLENVLEPFSKKKILVFTGKKSYADSIEAFVAPILSKYDCRYFSDFSSNPKSEEVEKAVNNLSDFSPDLIIAIGGGSVIDFAKSVKFSIDNNISVKDYVNSKNKPCLKDVTPIIAIPTTAGTGSEETQFAVVYVDGVKNSLDDISLLPQYAIVDSDLCKSNNRYLKACCAMDAFCQAIEGYWSVNSNDDSKSYSAKAIKLCKGFLAEYVNTQSDEAARKIAEASNLAGKSINIARTTLSHAMSYNFTSKYGLPHGHAVALSIAKVMEANLNATEENTNDTRGAEYVKSNVRSILGLLDLSPENICDYFYKLMSDIGLETSVSKLGVDNLGAVLADVNPDRMKNNPVQVSKEQMFAMFVK